MALALAGRKRFLGCTCVHQLLVPSRFCWGFPQNCSSSQSQFALVTVGWTLFRRMLLVAFGHHCMLVSVYTQMSVMRMPSVSVGVDAHLPCAQCSVGACSDFQRSRW